MFHWWNAMTKCNEVAEIFWVKQGIKKKKKNIGYLVRSWEGGLAKMSGIKDCVLIKIGEKYKITN